MADTREQILDRLTSIATELAGFVTAVRNRGLRTNEKRPALIVLDGDEAPKLVHEVKGRIMSLRPSIMNMRPELYILMDEQRPTNEELGPALNAKRVALIKAIAEDEELLMLLGSNGNIIYNGCVTDLKSGMALSGQMRLDFLFTYTFFPTTNQTGVS